MNDLTQQELKKILVYYPQNGLFKWRNTNRRMISGCVSGSINNRGYINIKINGCSYKAHRLAFFYVNGEWPKKEVDHINHVKNDNRWCNLRECNRFQNKANVKKHINNKSGYKGVYWKTEASKWVANISANGKKKHLGYFNNKDDAAREYNNAAKDVHGEFAYLNIIGDVNG